MRILTAKSEGLQGRRHSVIVFAALFGHRSRMFRRQFFDLVSVPGMHLSVLFHCVRMLALKPVCFEAIFQHVEMQGILSHPG